MLSAQEETRLIENQVAALVTAGKLDSSSAKALITKLDGAISSLNHGATTAGMNQLKAFVNQVNAFVKSGRLTSADSRVLIGEIEAAMAAAWTGAF